MTTYALLQNHPKPNAANDAYSKCIEACLACTIVCTVCADSCLSGGADAAMVDCVRTDLDCADLCAATARIVARQSGSGAATIRAAVEACAAVCRACAEECRSHADQHEHCKACAEACERCAEACEALAA